MLASILSCETTFEPNIANEPQLVVNGFFGKDFPASIQLHQTIFITDRPRLIPITDALITIEEMDTRKTYDLTESLDGLYVSNFADFAVNGSYKLIVNAPEFEEASAIDIITSVTEIISFSVAENLTTVNIDEQGFKANITFDDKESDENFYVLELILASPGTSNIFNESAGLIFFEDADIDVGGNSDIDVGSVDLIDAQASLFFTDSGFEQERVSIDFFLAPSNSSGRENRDIYAVLKSVSRAYYEYLLTTQSQIDLIDKNTFVEPIQIKGNIENGLGVFAGFSLDTLKAERDN